MMVSNDDSIEIPEEMLEQWDSVQNSLKQLKKTMVKICEPIRASIEPANEAMQQLNKQLSEVIIPVVKYFNEDFPKEKKVVFEHLAKRGWFLTGDMPLATIKRMYTFLKEDENGKEEIEKAIEKYIGDETSEYAEEILGIWPDRSHILEQAFEAHEHEMYAVSIPTFLTQADGMFKEIGRTGLFDFLEKDQNAKKKEMVKKFKKLAARENSITYSFFLKQVLIERTINQSSNILSIKRGNDPDYAPLNRHEILHGKDINYPSKSNSRRVISLLKYLTDMKIILF